MAPAGKASDGLDRVWRPAYIEAMTEEPREPDKAPAEAPEPPVTADVEHSDSSPGTGDFTTEVDPTFIPDDSSETPEEKRAREHPEATGS